MSSLQDKGAMQCSWSGNGSFAMQRSTLRLCSAEGATDASADACAAPLLKLCITGRFRGISRTDPECCHHSTSVQSTAL